MSNPGSQYVAARQARALLAKSLPRIKERYRCRASHASREDRGSDLAAVSGGALSVAA